MMRQISTEALAGLLVALCACAAEPATVDAECVEHADCYRGEGFACAACEPDGHCLYVGETGAACGEAGICVDWRCIEVR
jgi:hypothetical protein